MIDSLLGGGAERVAVEAALALDPDRYVPHLLVTRHTGPLEQRLAGTGLRYTILGRRGAFTPKQLAEASGVIRRSDLLHAHKFEGGAWGALLARVSRRPLVTHEHTFTGVITRRRTLLYRHLIGPSAARIVCVADSVARSLVADGVPREKLAVVPNGVPVQGLLDRDAARRELGLELTRPTIGIVAHLRPEKRHELALRGLAVLREKRPDVVLCVVGDGLRRDELQRLAQELGVDDGVVWAGERREAHRLHRAFDVTLLCSTFEGMPLAALESLVAGVPVVSTAVGAMPELLRDGNGAIVDPEPVALAAGIDNVLVHGGDEASERSDRNRGRYGIDRMARELEGIYDAVLEGART
jgi:glycosyltransferase involved in cell wall biosynthesis